MTDELTAALAKKRGALAAAWSALDQPSPRARGHAFGTAVGIASTALDAMDAALKFHERVPLYGNAATEDEPDACPHDPDSDLHFEGDGEWLCEGKPEGAVCGTCTEDGLPVAWPCPEYAAILAALTGKGADSG